ncbi:ABC transporter [Protofrankia coriariae]|uniref:ABC transporter n=1 Tax=Protofrankia coriariae TaxID=1562887 RepID=A0ABR5F078_9ACTN|nr:ABC transporter ATP-binding protein [Protofrankia coriariae]KLL10120.1 ABC transporter [Protofrankia coriariae]
MRIIGLPGGPAERTTTARPRPTDSDGDAAHTDGVPGERLQGDGPSGDGAYEDGSQAGELRLRGLWRLLRGHGSLVGIATALTVVGTVLGVAQPLLVKDVIDLAQAGGVPGSLILLLFALFVGQALTDTLGNYLLERAGQGILLDLRIRLVDHLLRLRIGVYDRRRIGDLISRANTDTTLVREAVAYSFSTVVTSVIGVIGAVVMMVWLDALLFLLVLLAAVVAGVMVLGVMVRIRITSERGQASIGSMTADLERALTTIRTVRASRAERRESARIAGHARDAYRAGVRMAALDSVVAPAIQLAVQGSVLVVLLVGGVLVARGSTSLGDLVAFLLYATYLVIPLSDLFEVAGTIQRGMGGLRRVDAVFALPREPDTAGAAERRPDPGRDGPGPRALRPAGRHGRQLGDGQAVEQAGDTPAVEFRNVWFGYSGEPVLRDVSFTVPPRGHIALVGRSGAGKSTVFQLIERFYEPDRGTILFGGRDVDILDRATARTWVNLVEQQTPVLQGTLRDNIVYAAPDATEDELRWAISTAGLADLVARIPDRLDTEVGDHGVLLSGGERQRVAIARALLARPAVLLMDEPTSQMDSLTERALTRAMRQVSASHALLVIAHRISTVRAADRIIVLDEGKVAATGHHEHLMRVSPLYQELASSRLDADPDLGRGRP